MDNALKEYEKRRKTAIEHLNKIEGVTVSLPKGAFYCLVKLPVSDSDHFAKWMLESFQDNDETLMVAPANGFFSGNTSGKDMIRIAFVLNSKKLIRAINILKLGLDAYQK